MVGDEMATYNFHEVSINMANVGKIINPIDQNNSNTTITIFLALPCVMSTTL